MPHAKALHTHACVCALTLKTHPVAVHSVSVLRELPLLSPENIRPCMHTNTNSRHSRQVPHFSDCSPGRPAGPWAMQAHERGCRKERTEKQRRGEERKAHKGKGCASVMMCPAGTHTKININHIMWMAYAFTKRQSEAIQSQAQTRAGVPHSVPKGKHYQECG